jgi:hypothetical protein
LRAFKKWSGLILPVFKPDKYVSDEQFSFKKPTPQHLPLLKAGHGQILLVLNCFWQIQTLLALNS